MIPKAFSLLTLVVVFYAVLKVAYGSVITGASNVDKNDEEESHRVPVLDPLTFNYPKNQRIQQQNQLSNDQQQQQQHLLHSRQSVPNQGSSSSSSSSSSKDQAGLYQDEDIHNSQSSNVARLPGVVSPYPRSSSSSVVVDSNGRAYEVSPKSQLDGSQPGLPSASFWPDGSTVYLDWGQHVDCSFRCYEADQSRYLYDCMMGCTAHLAAGRGGGGNAGPGFGNEIGFGSGPPKFPNMF